jgi:hypothetical protein
MIGVEEPNYYQTLITVAEDCPVASSVVPAERGGKKTVAVLQYDMLAEHPYLHTQPDVLFDSWLARTHPTASPAEVRNLREQFFAKPQPCLRSSPLPKKYGFGLLFDAAGRVKLCPMESAEYSRASKDERVQKLKALRSSRA